MLSLQTVRSRTFLLRGRLDCSSPGLDWELALFSEGLVDKTWSREKQEDGSFSINSEKSIILFWDKGAGGMIVEKGDTIDRFFIAMNPRTEENLMQFAGEVYSHNISPVKAAYSNPAYLENFNKPMTEYGPYGILRNRNYALMANGITYQTFIYSGSDLI